jgi:hypothetical protein
MAATCEGMDSIDHLIRHWKNRPIITVKSSSCSETKKIISTLQISGRSEGNGADSSCMHAIAMLFVCLHVSTKF